MTVSLGSSLASKGICLFVDLCWLVEGAALSRRTQNEIVVSWITLWGMIKVYWLDFSLRFRSCCLLRVCRKFGPKLASHYKPVENEVKLDCPNHIRRSKCSIKKRIIVRRSVRSMFGRTNIRPVKNGQWSSNRANVPRTCWAKLFGPRRYLRRILPTRFPKKSWPD